MPDLLIATAGGDRRAFRRVYELTSSKLFAVTLRIVRRRDVAEDVLQDAYLSIWEKAGQYHRQRGRPLAWMAGIVRHRAIDRLRAHNRQPLVESAFDDDREAEPNWDRSQAILPAGVTGEIKDCLGRLHDNQHRAILLAYYYGMTHEELAEQLEAPLGTVKSWIRRGLLQLKDCLEE